MFRKCMSCRRAGTVRQVESNRGLLQFRFYCARHSGLRRSRSSSLEAKREVVRSLLRRKFVVTERPDPESRTGEVGPHVAVGPAAGDGVSMHEFAAFLASLRIRIEEGDLSERVIVRRESAVQAEIRLVESARAGATWVSLAALIDTV